MVLGKGFLLRYLNSVRPCMTKKTIQSFLSGLEKMKRRLKVLVSFVSVKGARKHTRARLFLEDKIEEWRVYKQVSDKGSIVETTTINITMNYCTAKCSATFYRSILMFIFLYRCSFTLQSFQSLWTPTTAGTKDHI